MNARRRRTLLTVALKELKDFFRDPRSLIISLLLPVLLFPLLFLVLTREKPSADTTQSPFRVARGGTADAYSPLQAKLINRILSDPRLELASPISPPAASDRDPRELLLEDGYDLVLAETDDGSGHRISCLSIITRTPIPPPPWTTSCGFRQNLQHRYNRARQRHRSRPCRPRRSTHPPTRRDACSSPSPCPL